MLLRHFAFCAEWQDELRDLFAAYVAAKQRQHVLDYDDLLLYWNELMQVPELAAEIGQRFDHVLVDEYQDTNALQGAILLGLKPDGAGLTVVGDDAQAIYGFRAATVRNILDFPNQFSPPARDGTLEENYRSTQPILAASNAVIGLARERFTKNLRAQRSHGPKPRLVSVPDDFAQASHLADRILEEREGGIPFRDQAVLFRASFHSALLELELARRRIPFVKYGGMKFMDAAHVKDLLALLRWAENLRDRVAGFRVLQLLDGIGPATAGKALDDLELWGTDALAQFRPPLRASEGWLRLVSVLQSLLANDAGWPAEMELVRTWYRPHMEQRYADAMSRANDLGELKRIVGTYESRTAFLADVTLDPPNAVAREAGDSQPDEDYLVLSTIHSAKGQEWKTIYILNAVEGCIPSDLASGTSEELEEERRLLYVAMTRAKDQLSIMVPQRFYGRNHGSGEKRASRTRFIPPAILHLFDCVSLPQPGSLPGVRTARIGARRVDVAARARAMWRAPAVSSVEQLEQDVVYDDGPALKYD